MRARVMGLPEPTVENLLSICVMPSAPLDSQGSVGLQQQLQICKAMNRGSLRAVSHICIGIAAASQGSDLLAESCSFEASQWQSGYWPHNCCAGLEHIHWSLL